jgi:threonine aldolase
VVLEPARPATNIVIARLPRDSDPAAVCAALRDRGVLVSALETGALRFVTHCDVSEADIEVAAAAFGEALAVECRSARI